MHQLVRYLGGYLPGLLVVAPDDRVDRAIEGVDAGQIVIEYLDRAHVFGPDPGGDGTAGGKVEFPHAPTVAPSLPKTPGTAARARLWRGAVPASSHAADRAARRGKMAGYPDEGLGCACDN